MYLTDGCVEVSRAPDLYLNERAREIAPVRMTGLYGGEILRRSARSSPRNPPGLFHLSFSAHIRRAEGDLCRTSFGGHPVSFAVFKQAPWHHYGVAGAGADATLHALPIPRQRLCPNSLSGAGSDPGGKRGFLALDSRWKRGSLCEFQPIAAWREIEGHFMRRLPGGFSSSCSKRSTPTTWECPSGCALDHSSRPWALNVSSSEGTRSSISASGTVIPSQGTFGKCCLTRVVFRGHISNERRSKPWSGSPQGRSKLHHRNP